MPKTSRLIAALPDELVAQLIAWAPPVVAPPDADGSLTVISAHWSAVLARQRLPGGRVRVRGLLTKPVVHRSLPEICCGLVSLLGPLVEDRRAVIAALAGSEMIAQLLTGYSRATFFRLRRSSGG